MKTRIPKLNFVKYAILFAFLLVNYSSSLFAAPSSDPLTATHIGSFPPGVSFAGVTGDDNGNIYAMVLDGSSIYKITSDGTTSEWASGLTSAFGITDLQTGDGYIYSSKYLAGLYRSPLSDPMTETSEGSGWPAGGQFGALAYYNNKIYVCVNVYPGGFPIVYIPNIYEVDIVSGVTSLYLQTSDGLPATVTGMTVGSNGYFYFTDGASGNVYEYNGSSFSVVLSGLGHTSDIEEDANGKFYVALKNVGVKRYNDDFTFDTDLPEGTAINDWNLGLVDGEIVFSKNNTSEIFILEPAAPSVPISSWALVLGFVLIGLSSYFIGKRKLAS